MIPFRSNLNIRKGTMRCKERDRVGGIARGFIPLSFALLNIINGEQGDESPC
jgi:hypothetical protein